jgi:hypothetical protein
VFATILTVIMPYTSIIYNVMIASPEDVNDERKIARELILDWNNIHSLTRNIVLLPIGWEYNSVPSMGDRPQEIINKQVLKNADLLVGIFWTRIGTPTGKAISGSVEEIEEHINSGKPTMLYFSNKPVVPSSIDGLQYTAVNKLKKEYQSKGLTEDFESLDDFKNKFQRHLSMKLNTEKYFIGFPNDQNNPTNDDVVDDRKIIPPLTKEAKNLLKEASNDPSGTIIRLSYIGGFEIQTNGKSFVKENDPKSKALWTGALDELERNLLIAPTSYKKEIYELTNLGYQVSNYLT